MKQEEDETGVKTGKHPRDGGSPTSTATTEAASDDDESRPLGAAR